VFRPSIKFIQDYASADPPLAMRVTYGNQTFKTTIAANALWFGCDADVSVPPLEQARWFAEVKPEDRNWVQLYWLAPTPILDEHNHPPPPLNQNTDVWYEIDFPDQTRKYKVSVQGADTEFPQAVPLKAPEEK
jgi:hypothetical protein